LREIPQTTIEHAHGFRNPKNSSITQQGYLGLALVWSGNHCHGGRKRAPGLLTQQATKAKSRQAGRTY
jgi:hypothetical protein